MSAGALVDLIYKWVQNRGIDSATFVLYQATTFTVTIWVIAGILGYIPVITPTTWFYGLPLGASGYIGIVLFVASLKDGDGSINAPIFRLSFVITSILSFFFLNEPVTLFKVAGILLAVVAVLSLADLSLFTKSQAQLRSLIYVFIAMFVFGITFTFAKQAMNQGVDPIPLLLVQTITFTASAFVYMFATRGFRLPNRITLQFAPLAGILQLLWSFLLFQALHHGQASISFPIVQLSFVLTAILAVVFLRERASRSLFFGLSTASMSVIAFALT